MLAPMSVQNCVVAISIYAVCLGWTNTALSGEEIVVEVESVVGVAEYYEQIGFYDIDNHPDPC